MGIPNFVVVAGWRHPARPPGRGSFHSDQQRFFAIAQSLKAAAFTCKESDRALYQLILPALSAALSRREALKHETVQLTLDEATENVASSPGAWS